MPRRQRAAAPWPLRSAPSKRTTPPEGSSAPASTFRSVVFPAPFGPTIPTFSCSETSKSTSSRTTRAPKRFRSPATARIGVPPAGLTKRRLRVALQLRLDRDVLVVRVLADQQVELELSRFRLHPLVADD